MIDYKKTDIKEANLITLIMLFLLLKEKLSHLRWMKSSQKPREKKEDQKKQEDSLSNFEY